MLRGWKVDSHLEGIWEQDNLIFLLASSFVLSLLHVPSPAYLHQAVMLVGPGYYRYSIIFNRPFPNFLKPLPQSKA